MNALEVERLTKVYGEVRALDSVTFSVVEGEIFGLLGPNGSGKTTLMEVVAGIRSPTSGSVRVFGLDAFRRREEVSRLIGFNPQETMLYGDLSGWENLRFVAALYGLDGREFRERVKELSEILGIRHFLDRRVDRLSGGQRRRISLMASVLHSPRLLILDEPTVGLDPEARRDFWDVIWRLRDEGSTILLSTHYMEEADELCDRVAIIDRGRVVALGRPEELKRRHGGTARVIVYPKLRLLEEVERVLREMGLEVTRTGDGLAVETGNPEERVPRLTAYLSSRGLRPERIEIRSPTLEDVFLNLTGRPLAEVMG